MTVTSIFICLGSIFSDYFGRKPLFFVVSVITALGSLISLIKDDFNFVVAGVAIQTLCN